MKTSSLRFVTVRDPEPSHPTTRTFPFDPAGVKTDASHAQSLYKALDVIHQNSALKPAEKVTEIRRAVAAFKSSGSFISDARQFDELYPGFAEFRDWLASGYEVTVEEIHRRAEKLLRISERETLPAERVTSLIDNLIAHVILNEEPALREKISSALRINNLVQKAGTVRGAADLRKLIGAPVILPDVLFPPSSGAETPTAAPAPKEDPAVGERQRDWEKLNKLSSAYEELTQARGMQIQAAPAPPAREQPAERRSNFFSNLFRTPPPPPPPEPPRNDFVSSNLRKEHLESLSSPTREVMGELRIQEGTPFSAALSKFERRGQELATQIGRSISPYTEKVLVGTALVDRGYATRRAIRGFRQAHAIYRCKYKFPFKIADLRIVEQELKDYLAGEVAHVENILQGELKERGTRRLRRTEKTIFTSEEREEENQRDTQTTDSFQLEKEISKTVKKDTELEVNAKVDTEYYGTVIVKGSASAGYAASDSAEHSTREAVSYAKNVVERSSQKIIERVKEERTLKTTEEFEENNRHVLNNVGGQHHVVGVYRWLNKEYRVWLKNYGKRLMFELMIPEPAAYHLYAMTQKKDDSTSDLDEPKAPNDAEYAKELGVPGFALVTHQSITPFNYPAWAAAYGAEVEPPPPDFVTISTAIAKPNDTIVFHIQASTSVLTAPPGYAAKSYSVVLDYFSGKVGGTGGFGVVRVGLHAYLSTQYNVPMNDETGGIPVTMWGFTKGLSAHVEVICKLLPEALEGWKIKTFKAITDAYEAKRAEYRNALAEARAGAGVFIRGTNPLFNKTIIHTELKKNAIRLMAHCNPLRSSAMTNGEGDFDCCQVMAESPYIKFVEQVFEWRNMVYEFYPYFWAEEEHWTSLYNLSDTDPLFQNFLKAGYARILVPVTPGYNLAAMNFVTLGTPDLNDLAAMPVLDIINGMDEDAPTLAPARVSTQADVDLASPGATIDGVALAVGDRVLVRFQTLVEENGVYDWNGSAVPMTRAADADAPVELAQAVVAVTEGTDKGFLFRQTELPLNTLGTDPVVFKISEVIINESLLIPTDLTILECKSAGIDPTTMKILGLCQTAGVMTPFIAAASEPEEAGTAGGAGHAHGAGDGHEH